jgi:hypothetical protein
MRYVKTATLALAAATLASVAAASPAAARDFPWCLQGRVTGIPGDCSFRTRAECMTAASGRSAHCAVNPRTAFGRTRHGRSAHPQY